MLKARQLGMSTIVRALLVFWAYMHPGLRVALVFDTDKNKEEARQEINLFIDKLPSSHRIPVRVENKNFLQLANGSRISYLVAGVKKSKSSGGLGRSLGLNCCGATEMSSWADEEGIRAFERSLAQQFENRLYVFESTARGFNIFYKIWEEAKNDDITKRAIFIGWWANELYSIPRDTPLFDRYARLPPDEEEERKIKIVADRYGHDVTMEQLAWYRHEYDPNREREDADQEAQEFIRQELPWFEEEAWVMSGSLFFPEERLSPAMANAIKLPYKAYDYAVSEEFLATAIYEVRNPAKAMLKVWQEPEEGAVYCVGADPAHGSNEDNDRHVAQVIRCYADGVDQVAEFATNQMIDYQFAWVLAHLCGVYKNARLLVELAGPGHTVWNEFRNLQQLLSRGYLHAQADEMGMANILDSVKQYLWFRQDSLNRNPTAFQFVTSDDRKEQILTRLRDLFFLKQIKISSTECLREMQKIVRTDSTIKADGRNKDDRVIGLALACRAWDDSERKSLIGKQLTRENSEKLKVLTQQDVWKIFNESMVGDFFNRQSRDRLQTRRAVKRGNRYNF